MAYNFLVVDDSYIVRSVVKKTLHLCGCDIGNIYEAGNGKEALDIMSENWVDMVFADINMPIMDGIELIRSMEQNGLLAELPVAVISTEGSETRINKLKEMGVNDFLRKPFTPEQIRELIAKHLGKRNEHSTAQ